MKRFVIWASAAAWLVVGCSTVTYESRRPDGSSAQVRWIRWFWKTEGLNCEADSIAGDENRTRLKLAVQKSGADSESLQTAVQAAVGAAVRAAVQASSP